MHRPLISRDQWTEGVVASVVAIARSMCSLMCSLIGGYFVWLALSRCDGCQFVKILEWAQW